MKIHGITLKACSRCGIYPDELDKEHRPKETVAAYHLGKPWKYGVWCQICNRIALGNSPLHAVQNWNFGEDSGDWTELTQPLGK